MRKRDGETVDAMTWEFSEQNHLVRRTVMVDQRHLSADGFDPATLDDHGSPQAYYYDENPWPRSVPKVAADGGCLELPNSVSHGYPEAEPEYDLLSNRADRPNGIGWAYGNNSYGWNYGDLAWYGHAGVTGLESPIPLSNLGLRLTNDLRYVRSRMVSETIASLPAVDSTETVATVVRERTLCGLVGVVGVVGVGGVGGVGTGKIVSDRLEANLTLSEFHHAAAGEDRFHGRELRFERDAAGHLLGRTLHDDDHGLLEGQTWTRDAGGRWLSHDVSSPSGYTPLWYSYGYYPCEAYCEGAPSDNLRRYEREVDAAGRTTVHRDMWLVSGVASSVSEVLYRYDEAGRLVEQSQGSYVQFWTYDEAGRLIQEGWDNEGDGRPDAWTDYEYDAEGRWVRKTTYYQAGTSATTSFRAFLTCE